MGFNATLNLFFSDTTDEVGIEIVANSDDDIALLQHFKNRPVADVWFSMKEEERYRTNTDVSMETVGHLFFHFGEVLLDHKGD